MSRLFAAENRVHAATVVHHDTHLYPGQKVVISDRQTGLFGEPGEITYVGYNPYLGEVITIDLTNRLTWGTFDRGEFRLQPEPHQQPRSPRC